LTLLNQTSRRRSYNFDQVIIEIMENYVKAEKEDEFIPEVTIEGMKEGTLVMHVKHGSKIKNLTQFAEKRFATDPSCQIVWEGSGDAVQKTITCAEIMKKKSNYSLHQITRLTSMRIVETWKPRLEGLDEIRVNRQLPLIKILLSKDPLDADANGYQAPEDSQGLFSRGQGGGRPKNANPNQRNQHQKRNRPKTGGEEKDETLLADSINRKAFEKKMKQDKKKKKTAGKPGADKKAVDAKLSTQPLEGSNDANATSSVTPEEPKTSNLSVIASSGAVGAGSGELNRDNVPGSMNIDG